MIGSTSLANLIRGFEPTRCVQTVNLLQFVDDTLIFYGVEEQIVNVKAILLFFEAVSWLKVNFFESGLLGVHLSNDQLVRFADVMGCEVGSFFDYLFGFVVVLGHGIQRLVEPFFF